MEAEGSINGGESVCDKRVKTGLQTIEALTAFCGILLLYLVLLGNHRRRCSPDHLLHFIVRNAPTVSRSAIACAAGLMFSNVIYNEFLVFWILFLLIAVANADSISASNLQDLGKTGHQIGSYYLLPFFYAGYVMGKYPIHDRLKYTSWLLFASALVKLNELLTAHLNASKSCGLAKYSKMISDYMSYEHKNSTSDDVQVQPSTMQGYKYIFSDEERGCPFQPSPDYLVEFMNFDQVITIDRVWNDAPFLNDELKDVFLAYSLFNLIKRTVAEYPMLEHDQPKTWRLVRDGLLSNEGGSDNNQRAFRVIEVELEFLFDIFFTKYPILYMYSSWFTYRKIILSVWVIALCLFSLGWLEQHALEREYFYHIIGKGTNVDFLVTIGILGLIAFVETIQLIKMFMGNWFKVYLITMYMRSSSREHNIRNVLDSIKSRFIPCVLLMAWKLDQLMPAYFRKAWSRKIQEYTLLQSYSYRPCMVKRLYYWLTDTFLEKPRPGQKKGSFTDYTVDIHKAVLDSLRTNWPVLSNGMSSLKRNGVDGLLSWSCTYQDASIQILVWHIATTLCEPLQPPDSLFKGFVASALKMVPLTCFIGQNNQRRTGAEELDYCLIATQLSKYCAYLVAFAPEFLPGNAHMTEVIFDEAVQEAKDHLKGSKTPADSYEKTRKLYNDDNARNNLLYMGSKLANQLHEIEDRRRWKILADFWAEMILFIAPSDRASAHVERLTRGGELVTQIWALLYHAGVPDRNSKKLQAGGATPA